MARNVGKKRGAQPRPSSGGGGGSGRKSLVAFAVGLFAGVALAGGIYLLGLLPTSMELRDREIACNDIAGGEKKPADESNSSEPAADKKPVTFQFYDMLTKQQTVAPVAGRNTTNATPVPPPPVPPPAAMPPDTAPVAPAASTATPPPAIPPPASQPPSAAAPKPPVAGNRYSLQAGSFATRPEADRRRGELVFAGLDASVQQATTDKGDIRFRVMVGPFGDEPAMQKARQQLAGMKIDSLPVRLK